jgi:hypothetical protein
MTGAWRFPSDVVRVAEQGMPPMDLALAAGVSLMVESFGKR